MRAAVATATVVLLALAATPAGAATRARLEGTFSMRGRLTVVDNVRGEHRGQRVQRSWSFAPHCGRGVCNVTLTRRRGGRHKLDVLVLTQHRPGVYVGRGRFWVVLKCAGSTVAHGGIADETITVRITRAQMVGSTPFATAVSASYSNPSRTNLTRCPGGIGHDAAKYRGRLSSTLPAPPTASFSASPNLFTSSASFSDRSQGRIVAWSWSFGDPTSSDDTSTEQNPTHHYATPGTYTVTLTVRDKYGQTATTSMQVTV
jgi:PKD domain